MAGSDLPPSGSSGGGSPPPRTPPPRRAKRKRGDSAEPPSLPSRTTTRSSAAARKAMVGPLRMVRRAAVGEGALWTAKAGRGRGRGFGERMRAVILGLRLALSVRVPDDDDADSPCPEVSRRSGSRSSERINCKISYLRKFPEKRVVPHPIKRQASVPEWKNAPSDKEADDYKTETLTKLGTIVCPLNMDISVIDVPEKERKERVDNCNCSHPGSEDCVQVHIKKARSWIKDQLGEEAFKNCGLDAMGEQVGKAWTAVKKKKLRDVDKLIPQNKHQKFMKIALKKLSKEKKKDLAKYYYNVFLPRRLASLTRAEHTKDEAVDTDDEKISQDDNNNKHRLWKKSKCSESSSTRCWK